MTRWETNETRKKIELNGIEWCWLCYGKPKYSSMRIVAPFLSTEWMNLWRSLFHQQHGSVMLEKAAKLFSQTEFSLPFVFQWNTTNELYSFPNTFNSFPYVSERDREKEWASSQQQNNVVCYIFSQSGIIFKSHTQRKQIQLSGDKSESSLKT